MALFGAIPNTTDLGSTDNIKELADSYTGWTSWTPSFTQVSALTWVNDGSTGYMVIGDLCFFQAGGYFTSSGTIGNALVLLYTGLPTRATANFYTRNGSCHLYDSSANTRYIGVCEPAGSGYVFPIDRGTSGVIGSDPNIAITTNDQFACSGFYKVA